MEYRVEEKTREATNVIVKAVRCRHRDVGPEMGPLMEAVAAFASARDLAVTGMPFSNYSGWTAGGVTLTSGLPVEALPSDIRTSIEESDSEVPVLGGTLPAGVFATVLHVGPYEDLDKAHEAIEQWLSATQTEFTGQAYEFYLTDPRETPDPGLYRTEVAWEIVK